MARRCRSARAARRAPLSSGGRRRRTRTCGGHSCMYTPHGRRPASEAAAAPCVCGRTGAFVALPHWAAGCRAWPRAPFWSSAPGRGRWPGARACRGALSYALFDFLVPRPSCRQWPPRGHSLARSLLMGAHARRRAGCSAAMPALAAVCCRPSARSLDSSCGHRPRLFCTQPTCFDGRPAACALALSTFAITFEWLPPHR